MDKRVNLEDYLTSKEAGDILGITNKSIQRHIISGEMQAIKRGGRYFIHKDEIASFKPRLSGRPRTSVPQWRFSPEGNTLVGTSIEADFKEGITEEDFELALSEVKRNEELVFAGTVARYVLSNERTPRRVQILFIWRQTVMPPADKIEQALAILRATLADVLDWSTASNNNQRVWMHT